MAVRRSEGKALYHISLQSIKTFIRMYFVLHIYIYIHTIAWRIDRTTCHPSMACITAMAEGSMSTVAVVISLRWCLGTNLSSCFAARARGLRARNINASRCHPWYRGRSKTQYGQSCVGRWWTTCIYINILEGLYVIYFKLCIESLFLTFRKVPVKTSSKEVEKIPTGIHEKIMDDHS